MRELSKCRCRDSLVTSYSCSPRRLTIIRRTAAVAEHPVLHYRGSSTAISRSTSRAVMKRSPCFHTTKAHTARRHVSEAPLPSTIQTMLDAWIYRKIVMACR